MSSGPTERSEAIALLRQIRETRGPVADWVDSPWFAERFDAGLDPTPARNPGDIARLVDQNGRHDAAEEAARAVAHLPTHHGTHLRPHPVRIAVVADEPVGAVVGLADTVDLIPQDWWQVIDEVDAVLIWVDGVPQAWAHHRTLLVEVLRQLKTRSIPVILRATATFTKLGIFTEVRPYADLVIVGKEDDLDVVAKAAKRPVELWEPGANPFLYNPVGSEEQRLPQASYAGTWNGGATTAWQRAGRSLLQGAAQAAHELPADFVIHDDAHWGVFNERRQFPQQFVRHIGPGLDSETRRKLWRISAVCVHLGTSTGLPGHLLGMLATGALVVSNYNIHVNEHFPTVMLAESPIDVAGVIRRAVVEDPDWAYQCRMAGLRDAWSRPTAHAGLGAVLRRLGLPTAPSQLRIGVAGDPEVATRFLTAQSHTGAVALDDDQLDQAAAAVDVVVPVDRDHSYGRHYLADLAAGFLYTDADFVTKPEARDPHHTDVGVAPATRSAIWTHSAAYDQWRRSGDLTGAGYAVDPFQIEAGQIEPGPAGREVVDIQLWEDASSATPDPDSPATISVVVPVYNNGRFLEWKCMASLQRSSLWAQMEVLLVDDGSTDPDTVDVLERMARHDRVRWLRNEPTIGANGKARGSGSASRPRNQGLAAASGPYVTYLDPDNEMVNDGFAVLLDKVQQTGAHFAIGDMMRCDNIRMKVPNVSVLHKALERAEDGTRIVPDDALAMAGFKPMSIQALVADTAWLRGLGLEQPIGAVGQDSYFFQQMLHYADRIATVDLPIHIYYSGISTSTVNTISPNFFRKYLGLEQARSDWLREIGLLEDYVRDRHEKFVEVWHVPRLAKVEPEEYDEAVAVLADINAMYGITTWRSRKMWNIFGGDLIDSKTGDQRDSKPLAPGTRELEELRHGH